MKITYRTKEESKRAQELAFLKLSSEERLYAWLNLMYQSKKLLPNSGETSKKKENFEVVIQVKEQ